MAAGKGIRLDSNVRPLRYTLRIEPDFAAFTFQGEETITINIGVAMDEIALNARELKVISAWLLTGKSRTHLRIRLAPTEERVYISLGKKTKGRVSILLSFSGTNNDGMYGFYRCKYGGSKDHKDSYILSSQFEAADARAAFPCFDEPAFKAEFDLTLVIDPDLHAVSNMRIKKIRGINGKKEVTFETTPKMSSYLLYMGVGKFDFLGGRLGNLKIRVLTPPGKREQGALALDYAKKFIKFYEDYFGIKYPLPKLDLLAIPDFAAGAMENWGAITFRDNALLGTTSSSVAAKERIAEVIAHELTHQWFGDLVTMDWWSDIWLNESFATMMSYKAVHHVFPEWSMDKTFYEDEVSAALSADELKNTHPIYVEIHSTNEISSVFDSISYSKGGSILRMLEDYIGAETFRKGLHSYLKEHSYGNATKGDLWKALDAQALKDGKKKQVGKIAEAWITKPGYPVVSLDHDQLTQKRFLLSTQKSASAPWPIPLHYKSTTGEEDFVLFDRNKMSINTDGAKWTKLNFSQAGFYRSDYNKIMLSELGKAVHSGELGDLDAWGIGTDVFAQARTGNYPLQDYLGFIDSYMLNCGYPFNVDMFGHLGFVELMSNGTHSESSVKALELKYAKSVIKKIGFSQKPNDPTTIRTLRAAALGKLGTLGYAPAVSKSQKILDDAIHGRKVDPDLVRSAYSTIAWNGDAKEFGSLLDLYKKAQLPEEKIDALIALGRFKKRELIARALAFALSKDVRKQDTYVIPYVASGNAMGRDLVLKWTIANWKRLLAMYAPGTHMLGRYVENLSLQNTASSRDEIAQFFSKKGNSRGDITRSIAQTLERIDANIRFMEKNFGNGSA